MQLAQITELAKWDEIWVGMCRTPKPMFFNTFSWEKLPANSIYTGCILSVKKEEVLSKLFTWILRVYIYYLLPGILYPAQA